MTNLLAEAINCNDGDQAASASGARTEAGERVKRTTALITVLGE
jgi:hypothetical protein